MSPARAKLDIIVHELHFQVCALLCSVEACQAWSFVLPGNSVPQKKGYSVIHHPNLDTFIVGGRIPVMPKPPMSVGPFLGNPGWMVPWPVGWLLICSVK